MTEVAVASGATIHRDAMAATPTVGHVARANRREARGPAANDQVARGRVANDQARCAQAAIEPAQLLVQIVEHTTSVVHDPTSLLRPSCHSDPSQGVSSPVVLTATRCWPICPRSSAPSLSGRFRAAFPPSVRRSTSRTPG